MPDSQDVQIMVLGDPHGHWRRAASVVRGYHDVAGRWPDAVLVAGDMGYYPTPESMDRATRKHTADDPEQGLGLRRLLAPNGDPVVEALLDGAPPFVAIGGNHEAHELLAAWLKAHHRERPLVSLDPRGRLQVLRDGTVWSVAGVRVAGLWGIEPPPGRVDRRTPGKHIDPAAVARLRGSAYDLLLTHDGPRSEAIIAGQTVGSADITGLVAGRTGLLHCFGHYHFREGRRLSVAPGTQSVGLGILRPEAGALALMATGGPGRWTTRWLVEDGPWYGATRAQMGALPPLPGI